MRVLILTDKLQVNGPLMSFFKAREHPIEVEAVQLGVLKCFECLNKVLWCLIHSVSLLITN